MSQTPEPKAFSFVARGSGAGFLASLSVDQRLAAADIAGTLAHIEALRKAGLLNRTEAKTLAHALRTCLQEIEAGTFPWQPSLEDVHTNVEARVIALAGAAGEKLHAGRSRNDQVALDERIYLRQALERLLTKIMALQGVLLAQAKANAHVLVPSYTHLQRAQPILFSHALLAHFWRLGRDADRLHDAFARVNVSPAGAAAVAGTSLPLEVALVASLLGFDRPFANSIDATSDRDAFVEVAADLALLAVHLGQLSEDLVLWATQEFALVRLADEETGGSSYLPNKRNPDVPELVRGTAGSVVGDLVALLTMLKGLPLGYSRDLQADKAPAFHAVDTVGTCLEALTTAVHGLTIAPQAGSALFNADQSAALLVEFLVARGVPYREAYELVKAHLSEIATAHDAEERLAALRRTSRFFDEAALPLLTPEGAVAAIASHGGTGPAAVADQMKEAEGALGQQAYYLSLIAKKNGRIAAILTGEGDL